PLRAQMRVRRLRAFRPFERALRPRVADRCASRRHLSRLLQGVRAVLTGSEALARALAAARVRRAWSFPGSPLTKVEQALEQGKLPQHRFTVNENVAATLALSGALLTHNATAMLMKHVG